MTIYTPTCACEYLLGFAFGQTDGTQLTFNAGLQEPFIVLSIRYMSSSKEMACDLRAAL